MARGGSTDAAARRYLLFVSSWLSNRLCTPTKASGNTTTDAMAATTPPTSKRLPTRVTNSPAVQTDTRRIPPATRTDSLDPDIGSTAAVMPVTMKAYLRTRGSLASRPSDNSSVGTKIEKSENPLMKANVDETRPRP